MDFLPGKLLIKAPVEMIPEILGKARAVLHRADPQMLVTALKEQGIDEAQCRPSDSPEQRLLYAETSIAVLLDGIRVRGEQ